MKTVTFTAEELRWLEYFMSCNPCKSECVVHLETGHYPRGLGSTDACMNCRLAKAERSISKKLWGTP